MSPKRILLWLLTCFALALLGSSLLASFNQPQVQGRLELYQTNLLLVASEWQGDSTDPSTQVIQSQILGDNPRTTALEQYRQARDAALKLRQSDPALLQSLGRNWLEEVTLKQGLLEAVTGDLPSAQTHWQSLTTGGATSPFSPVAQVLMGLWADPPQLLPNAESLIQNNLQGWFEVQALERLYGLQQRSMAQSNLAQSQQDAAAVALLKLLVVSGLPLVGGAIGVAVLLGLGVQTWRKGSAFPPLGDPAPASTVDTPPGSPPPSPWVVPWDGETTWQVLVVGFFFVGQIVVSQIFAPLLLLGLQRVPSLTDPAYDLRAKAIYVLLVYFSMALGVLVVLYGSIKPYLPLPAGWFRVDWGSSWLAWGIGGYLMALPLVTVTALVNQQIWQGQGGSNPILTFALENKDTFALGCFFTTAAIAAPLFEEFLFRGFLLASLTRYFSSWGAIALSGLIFAVAHLSLSEVLPLFVLGMVLGYVYRRSQNLLAPMVLHSLWNSSTLVGLVVLGTGN